MSKLPEENFDLIPEQEEPQVSSADPNEEATPAKKKVQYDESLFEGSTVFSAPTAEKKEKTPRLKPATRGVLLSAIAVAVAAAVALTVFLLPDTDNGGTSSTATETYSVVSLKQQQITGMKLYNANGSYRIYPKEDEKASSQASSQSDLSGETTLDWQVEGYERYDLSGAESLINGAISVEASKKLTAAEGALLADDYVERLGELPYGSEAEEGEEANIYGFDHPYAAFTVDGVDENDSYTILLGCYSPDGAGRYVSKTGDKNIYIVNDAKFNNGNYDFDNAVEDLINTTMVEPITENAGTTDYYVDGVLNYIDTIVLSGSCRSRMVVETAPEELSAVAFVVTEPAFRAGNEDNIANILAIAEGNAYASGAYVLGYSKSDLDKYGLSDPFSVIEINIGTYKVKLSFGAETDGYYPCIVEGSDIIFKVSAESNEWVAYGNKDVYFDSLFLEYIANISQITVETEEKAVTFNLVRENDDDGLDFDVKVKDYEDLKISTDELCYYYGRILKLSAEEYTTSVSPTDTPYISFKIKYIKEGRADDEIKLYRYSTRRYLYTLNGKGDALVAASTVQDLYDCLDALLNGETIGRADY